MAELDLEAQVSALPPVVVGGLVVIPAELLAKIGVRPTTMVQRTADSRAVAARARSIVMEVEHRLGYEPVDREADRLGYDIESRDSRTGKLRFIEVKGRTSVADTVTVTRNEILTSLNKPEDYILGIVQFLDDGQHRVHYVRRLFRREPDFGVISVNYDFGELLARAEEPR